MSVLALSACNASPQPHVEGRAHVVTSNMLREDYAGSEACAPCHHEITERWRASAMHNMTRTMPAVVHAPFAGTVLRLGGDRVDLEAHEAERIVHVHSASSGDRSYRVTRVIGGHRREDFAGVEIGRDAGGDELVLPISYLLWSKRFRYKGYSVMSRERPGVTAGPVWNRTCIFCHNTEPYLLDVLGADHHVGYQGELVDALLPASRRSHLVLDDKAPVRGALEAETRRLTGGASSTGDFLPAASITREHFTAADLVEVGIGCEACHGGSKEHVRDPTVHTSLAPHTQGLHFTDMDAHAARVNRTCARCHQVLFSHYPATWEAGQRDRDPTLLWGAGGSHINSGEARDFLLSRCSTRADCTLCHDPHAPESRAKALALETQAGDAICTSCHGSFATAATQRAHTHHDPAGAGGRCVACHMPRKNMSLDLGLARYHRIGSPNATQKLLDRPMECALCHVDATVGALADAMERWWPQPVARSVLADVYGGLDANVVEATLARGKPHEQAVALALVGEHRVRRSLPAVTAQLANEVPLVRFYAEHALEQTLGRPSPLDMYAPQAELQAAAAAWVGTP